jgi:hypothetical protein
VISAAATPVVVHCCAPEVPLELIRSAGAVAVALDLDQLDQRSAGLDALGRAVDDGLGLLLGAAPALPAPGALSAPGGPAAGGPAGAERGGPAAGDRGGSAGADGGGPSSAWVADRVRRIWDQLGFPRTRLAAQVVVTPACGLAGADGRYVRRVLAACRDAGRRFVEQ